MTTAGDIVSRASTTLFDETNVRWSTSELLEYLSDAQKEIVLLKPTAFTKNEAVQLVPGTLQSLPAGGVELIDIGGNMGLDGQTPGRDISQIDRTALAASRPDWRSSTANLVTRHYIFDDRDPTHFEVYPPRPNPAGYIQVSFVAEPDDIEDENSAIGLSEIYDTPLYYLVLSRAFTKSTGTQDFNKAASYLNIAHQLVTGRKLSKRELHPEQLAERAKK